MISCPLCNSSENIIFAEEGRIFENAFKIYSCSSCGLSFAERREEAIGEHYEIAEWYGIRWEFKEVLKLIKNKNIKLLEIGCGRGYFLNMAFKEGVNSFGIDINQKAIDFAKKNFGLTNVFSETLDDFLEKRDEKDFDIVCLFHILEHLQDPKDFISKIANILKRGGLLCLSFPNPHRIDLKMLQREHWDYPPHHLTRWNEKSIRYLLDKTGFDILNISLEPLSIIKCTESIGTYFQTAFIKRKSEGKEIEKSDKDEKKRFFNLKNIIKPLLMFLFLPLGLSLYTLGKIKRYTGQAMLVIGKKR